MAHDEEAKLTMVEAVRHDEARRNAAAARQ